MGNHADHHQGQRDRRDGKPLSHSTNKHWIKGWKDEDEIIRALSPPTNAETWAEFLSIKEPT